VSLCESFICISSSGRVQYLWTEESRAVTNAVQLSWNLASLACLGIINLPPDFLILYLCLKMSSEPDYTIIISQQVWISLQTWNVRENNKKITIPVQLQVLPACGVNPGGGEIFRNRPDRPWGPSNLLHSRCRICPGVKAAGAWHWPPTQSSAAVKERVELYLYSPSGSLRPVLRWTLLFTFTFTSTTTTPVGVWCNSVRMFCKRENRN
jgi:hypothetical protein